MWININVTLLQAAVSYATLVGKQASSDNGRSRDELVPSLIHCLGSPLAPHQAFELSLQMAIKCSFKKTPHQLSKVCIQNDIHA